MARKVTREEALQFARRPNGHEPDCPYCGKKSLRVDSACIYGRSYGTIFLCPECDAYVGQHHVHRNDKKHYGRPLGTLANAETREWRKRAHAAFNPLYENRIIGDRKQTYAAMRHALGWTVDQAHIAKQGVDGCKKIVEWAMGIARTHNTITALMVGESELAGE